MGASLVPRTDGVMEAHSGSLVCRSRAGGGGHVSHVRGGVHVQGTVLASKGWSRAVGFLDECLCLGVCMGGQNTRCAGRSQDFPWRSWAAASLLLTRERYPLTSRSLRPSVSVTRAPMPSRFFQARTHVHMHMQHAHAHAHAHIHAHAHTRARRTHTHTRLAIRCRLARRAPRPLQGLVPKGPADCPRQDRRRSGGGAP